MAFLLSICFGVPLFFRVACLPIEKVCIIKNFEEENFSDFKWLIVTFKINPQSCNWPLKQFPSSGDKKNIPLSPA